MNLQNLTVNKQLRSISDISKLEAELTGEVMAIFWSDLSWMTIQFSVLLSFWKSGYTSLMSSMEIS